MVANDNEFNLLTKLYQDHIADDREDFNAINLKLDHVMNKMESNHKDLCDKFQTMEMQVEEHKRAFGFIKWIASSGGFLGMVSICKDWLPWIQHKP